MAYGRPLPDDNEAFGKAPPPHASEAFGSVRTLVPWWISHRVLASVILSCVWIAVLVAAASRNHALLSERAGGSPGSPATAVLSACHASPPQPVSLTAGQLSRFRARLLGPMTRPGTSDYTQGDVPPNAVWSDDPPGIGERASNGLWPAGYEIRQWAPDPQWGPSYPDDIVGDVFQFPAPSQAQRFVEEAPSCHREGAAEPAVRPPSARNLTWINPEGLTQEDVFLRRGLLVYRIADVRPQRVSEAPTRGERDVGTATVDALACALPGANCPAPRAGTGSPEGRSRQST